MMKKFLPLFLLIVLLMPISLSAQKEIKIFINGDYVNTDVAPYIDNERILVPIRVISESLGAKVQWIQKSNKIIIGFHSQNIDRTKYLELTLNQKNVNILDGNDYKHFTMDVSPKVINNRVLVPIRFVTELMEQVVSWDQENYTVAIGEDYSPIQKKESLQIQYRNKNFSVKTQSVRNKTLVSLKDLTQGMGWVYSIDRQTYNFGGGGLGIILTDSQLNRKIIFQPRGISCDGIYMNEEDNFIPHLYVDNDYYVPLKELINGFHINSKYDTTKNLLTLSDNKDKTTYSLLYNLYTRDGKYKLVPSKLNHIVYKNNHYVLMPLNKTIEQYWNEKDALINQDAYQFIEDDAHLYEMNVFVLNPENKTITGIQAD